MSPGVKDEAPSSGDDAGSCPSPIAKIMLHFGVDADHAERISQAVDRAKTGTSTAENANNASGTESPEWGWDLQGSSLEFADNGREVDDRLERRAGDKGGRVSSGVRLCRVECVLKFEQDFEGVRAFTLHHSVVSDLDARVVAGSNHDVSSSVGGGAGTSPVEPTVEGSTDAGVASSSPVSGDEVSAVPHGQGAADTDTTTWLASCGCGLLSESFSTAALRDAAAAAAARHFGRTGHYATVSRQVNPR